MKLSLPAVQALRAEPTMIDAVFCTAADAHHPSILDSDVEPAAIAAQQACRRHPAIDVVWGQPISQMQVYTNGPGLAWRVGRSLAPDVVAGACCHAQGVPA